MKSKHIGKMSALDMHKDSDREPGAFTLPIYGASQLKGKTQAQIDDLKLKELRNGRLAMFGKHLFFIYFLKNFCCTVTQFMPFLI